MTLLRNKSISMKLTEEEYAHLEAQAGGRPLGEWTREMLLRERKTTPARPVEEALLAEVVALRSILLNALVDLGQGEQLSEERMAEWIEKADRKRFTRMHERLEEAVQARGRNHNGG